MKSIRINYFPTMYTAEARGEDGTWEEIVELLTLEHEVVEDKERRAAFNGARYYEATELDPESHTISSVPTKKSWVRRIAANVKQLELLILDFDGTTKIEEAKRRFAGWEHVGYTSWSHLAESDIHRFRVVFPLAKPITAKEWAEYVPAIEAFAGECDPVVGKVAQIYFLPSAPSSRIGIAERWHNRGETLDIRKLPGAESRAQPKRARSASGTAKQQNRRKPSAHPRLDPNQILNHRHGTVRARDVVGRIEHVICPFHDDTNGSEFIVKYEDSGVICFRCHRCGTYVLPPTDTSATAKEHSVQPRKTDDLLDYGEDYDDRAFLDPKDRQRVDEKLTKICSAIQCEVRFGPPRTMGPHSTCAPIPDGRAHILYMPEGAGKSRLAIELVRGEPYEARSLGGKQVWRRYRVLFACKSWQQVFEKYHEFRQALDPCGLQVKMAMSLDGVLQYLYGAKVQRLPARPFATGEILPEETIATVLNQPSRGIKTRPPSENFLRFQLSFLRKSQLDIEAVTECYEAPVHRHDYRRIEVEELEPAFSLMKAFPAIVLTTFAQTRLVLSRYQRVPRNWVIWFDDPDTTDVMDIEPVKEPEASTDQQEENSDSGVDELERVAASMPMQERLAYLRRHRKKSEPIKINGLRYHQRSGEQQLGLAFKRNVCIYTTTETLTRQLLEHTFKQRKEECYVHDHMGLMDGARITLLGTRYVWSRHDAFVPLLARRLQKEDQPVRLIADGLSSELNHANSKGKNTLKGYDLLVELSIPHPLQVSTINAALGQDDKEHNRTVQGHLMLDRMHQAIGRNSGFRFEGRECIVLVDARWLRYLTDNCRYRIRGNNSFLIDRTEDMRRDERRSPLTASAFVQRIESFLNTIPEYILDKRKCRPDIKHVVKAIQSGSERVKYVVRLLVALSSEIDVRFDSTTGSQRVSRTEKAFRQTADWLVGLVDRSDREKVWKNYGDRMDRLGG